MRKESEFKVCPFSNISFKAKRNNQVFATAKDRIAYHNEQNNFLRKKLSVINKQLLKNYKIVDTMLEDFFDISVHKEFLKGKGFSFKLFTHIGEEDGEIVFGLYDITIMKLKDEDYYYIKRTI